MKLKLRFSCFFMIGLLCFIVYMGLVIGLILEYVFPVFGLDNSGDDLLSFFVVFFIPFISGGIFFGLYFVNPMVFMMSLIAGLSLGKYDLSEADNRIYTKKGKLKKRFYLYREVIADLYKLALTLGQAEAERRKLEEAKENWIRGISHDLKTPLSYIVGYSALLTNADYEWSREEIGSFANEMYRKGKAIEDLIGDLRHSFQMENSSIDVPMSKETFDLIPFLQELIADIANMPGAGNYELDFQTSINSLFILGDRKLLQRAFQNLLVNAIYHNPIHTKVSMWIESLQDGIVCIEVGDSGSGVSEAIIKKVCEDDIKSNGAHGLDIVKSVIVAHNGKIIVESEAKRGTLFHVHLPIE